MLVKIGNKWVDASTVTGLDWVFRTGRDKKNYALYIYDDGKDCFCGRYNTKEGVIKAMDEAAEKINAAQGYKGKVVMRYAGPGNGQKYGVFRCSHCRFAVSRPDYDCCPNCGRKIERWE